MGRRSVSSCGRKSRRGRGRQAGEDDARAATARKRPVGDDSRRARTTRGRGRYRSKLQTLVTTNLGHFNAIKADETKACSTAVACSEK
ncbi:hypothetical protein BHM03_00037514 [Ensete ventricosum]|nr:hypothetical protein BHM03_00037514 [Ensete ventricosum]